MDDLYSVIRHSSVIVLTISKNHQSDPLAEVVGLLRPVPSISKMVVAGGRWKVERRDLQAPFYCAVIEGECLLTRPGSRPLRLGAGDFILIPQAQTFSMSCLDPRPSDRPCLPQAIGPGSFRLGPVGARITVRALVGHCRFQTPDRTLLISLLPDLIHSSGIGRLTALLQMIHDELQADRPAREMVLRRLLEVVMIEAFRAAPRSKAPPGLLRGLADPQLAVALRRIHARADEPLSVPELAHSAGMSRSVFFSRFRRDIGTAPMEYVTAWRMSLAKDMLCQGGVPTSEIASRVGYSSVSAFSMAFSRHMGMSPRAFAETAPEPSEAWILPHKSGAAV